MVTDQADLYAVATAFRQSRMVAVAVELDVFSLLADEPATLTELCARLRLHPRPTEALLNGLCTMGILALDGDRYRNRAPADSRLDRTEPDYTGGPFAVAGWQFPLWTRLRALLETGEPQGADAGLGFCPDSVALRRFVEAADARSARCGPALAREIDPAGATHVVDLGGARGTVLASILHAHPHLTGTAFDLHAVRPLFDEHATRLGLTDRMRFRGGDFFTDDLPPADVYLLGHLLSDWDDDRCAYLVARAARALRPGGTLLVHDPLIDPDRPHTNENWVHSLSTQLIGPAGTVNTTDDCRGWLAAAGLTGIEVRAFVDTESLVVGQKLP
ncbi:methyltransferase [Actinophytocola sp.]|uniref:methyltransferase n=1 Tax=Actinophytocola sp. TaxID=1872138 RepID=UPI0025C28CCC|nr:methyltransferase [Actinophytocola sp.]